jgi:regulator of sigma E protease
MMYQLAARSAEQGWDQFLHLMAVISINLGIMNLLPIPILDGFHLLAAGWEAVRRRPIPVRAREVANMFGLALLIALMVFAAYNDITRRW